MAILSKLIDRSHKCARIGYNNLLTSSTAPKVIIPNTFERFVSSAGATSLKCQLSSNAAIDYIAIGAHTAGTHDGGIPITISYATTIGGALTQITTVDFGGSNDAKMILFDAIDNVAEIELLYTTATAGLEIGVVYAGVALVMEQPIYGGHTPQLLSANTQYQSTLSETGQFLGRSITLQGTETTYSWRHLSPEFYRDTFQPFVDAAKTTPFFIKWRPDLYDETAYCHTTADVRPVNMGGGHKLLSVDMPVRGHSD